MKNLQSIKIAEKPLSFFDGNKELIYPIPFVTEKCPECGDFEWEQVDADWADGQSEKKWISFRCQGRVREAVQSVGGPRNFTIYTHQFDSFVKCEFVLFVPVDESTRIVGPDGEES